MRNLELQKCLIALLIILFHARCFAVDSKFSSSDWDCKGNIKLQHARSEELQNLAKNDQADRQNWEKMSEDEMMKIAYKDLIRRKRVGEIFGEGCFKEPKDYMAAALIYQHGNTADHYYQAFIWSRRADELGDLSGKSFSALAIDRYLINIGRKQLFGSQYHKVFPNQCYCMQPVERSFPDDFRKKYSGRSLLENYEIMASINKTGCPSIECETPLKATPKGSIVGLW